MSTIKNKLDEIRVHLNLAEGLYRILDDWKESLDKINKREYLELTLLEGLQNDGFGEYLGWLYRLEDMYEEQIEEGEESDGTKTKI